MGYSPWDRRVRQLSNCAGTTLFLQVSGLQHARLPLPSAIDPGCAASCQVMAQLASAVAAATPTT